MQQRAHVHVVKIASLQHMRTGLLVDLRDTALAVKAVKAAIKRAGRLARVQHVLDHNLRLGCVDLVHVLDAGEGDGRSQLLKVFVNPRGQGPGDVLMRVCKGANER